VVERAWIEKGRGYAEVRLSKRAEVEGIWQDVLGWHPAQCVSRLPHQ